MPTVEVYDQQGNVVETYEAEVPESPPSTEDRLEAVEEKLAAVAQLTDQANATAQDVAQRVRDSGKP